MSYQFTPQFGYVPDPALTRAVMDTLAYPTFGATKAGAVMDDDDSDALNYRAMMQVTGETDRLHSYDQGQVGSCVGNGTALGLDISLACELIFQRRAGEWIARAAADGMYGLCRDISGQLGRGDGSSGGAAAQAVQFGTLFQISYGDVDLTQYSANRCRQWASSGVPDSVKAAAKLHPVAHATRIDTWQQARAALQSGYGINMCSNQGFSGTRDALGFMRPQGSWSHSMGCSSFRGQASGKRGFLIHQSWGDSWSDGPYWPADQPFASFWCDQDTFQSMLDGGDCFAYSMFTPFLRKEPLDWGKG